MAKIVNRELHRSGMAYRAKVLGDARVREALATADDLTDYYHVLGHECAYGMVWPRQQLSPRLRSLVTVAMLATLGFESILRVHLLGAIRNGCTRADVRQVIATVTFYAGAAPASAAITAARAVLETVAPPTDDADESDEATASAASIRKKGEAIRTEMFGAPTLVPGKGGAAAVYNDIRSDYVFGVLWGDDALALRDRVLVVVAILCANNRKAQLGDYIRAALTLGCDATELEEVFLTAAIYCGVAACEEGLVALDAVRTSGAA